MFQCNAIYFYYCTSIRISQWDNRLRISSYCIKPILWMVPLLTLQAFTYIRLMSQKMNHPQGCMQNLGPDEQNENFQNLGGQWYEGVEAV